MIRDTTNSNKESPVWRTSFIHIHIKNELIEQWRKKKSESIEFVTIAKNFNMYLNSLGLLSHIRTHYRSFSQIQAQNTRICLIHCDSRKKQSKEIRNRIFKCMPASQPTSQLCMCRRHGKSALHLHMHTNRPFLEALSILSWNYTNVIV